MFKYISVSVFLIMLIGCENLPTRNSDSTTLYTNDSLGIKLDLPKNAKVLISKTGGDDINILMDETSFLVKDTINISRSRDSSLFNQAQSDSVLKNIAHLALDLLDLSIDSTWTIDLKNSTGTVYYIAYTKEVSVLPITIKSLNISSVYGFRRCIVTYLGTNASSDDMIDRILTLVKSIEYF